MFTLANSEDVSLVIVAQIVCFLVQHLLGLRVSARAYRPGFDSLAAHSRCFLSYPVIAMTSLSADISQLIAVSLSDDGSDLLRSSSMTINFQNLQKLDVRSINRVIVIASERYYRSFFSEFLRSKLSMIANHR